MRVVALLVMCFIVSSQIFSATHFIPSEYTTIQAGIDAASEGDTVLVAPGTYTGSGNQELSFNGTNIVLLSEKGADSTVIDGEYGFNGLLFDNGEDSTSLVDGFTFTQFETGIYMSNGITNLQNCVFTSIQDAIVLFYPTGTSSCRISECEIKYNIGGIYNLKFGTIIENCKIQYNNDYGIGMYAPTDIRYCLITNNQWAGIMQASGMNHYRVLVDHCTIVSNGHGIYWDRTLPLPPDKDIMSDDTSLVINSIVAFNDNYGIYNYWDIEAQYNCINSDVYGNSTNWQNDKYADGDEFGNISLDPGFCSPENGNYYLETFSPCYGLNMGAYGWGCEVSFGCCYEMRGNVDGDPDDIIDISDLVYLVTYSFQGGPLPTCLEEADVDNTGGLDIGDIVYLVSYMFIGGPEPVSCPWF